MSDGGKGDKRRPGDEQAFADNYGLIFGDRKPVRGSFVFDPVQQKLVPKEEYRGEPIAPMVMPDIAPYQSMVTGETISSRSTHRQHLKEHSLIEIGNETKYLAPKPKQLPPGLRETIARAVYQKLR